MKRVVHLFTFLLVFLFPRLILAQESQAVSGVIKDASGQLLAGATITEKGHKSNTTISDANGYFKMKVAPNATLVISYIGFQTKESKATGNNLIFSLEPSGGKQLNEVVVTSLGIQKQDRSLGYATTTIKADELVKTMPTNFATALYGKAPGVRIASAPGGSVAGVSIQIRGINSLFNRTQPLIVMDGVPIHDGDFNNGNYWGDQRVRGNSLIDLNPEDIESITVLKGASAAALYGSEATNGVIMITTKSGKSKKGISVDFNSSYFQDRVAYLPRFQNVRGAGSPVQYDVYGEDANGFNSTQYSINGQSYRALVSGSLNFGPKFDGQPIASWDGVVRPYSPIKNGWAHLFQNANNTTENLAFSATGDNASTRFSFTHQHYEGVSLNSSNDKYIFNINSNYKFSNRIRLNLIVNDIYAKVKNRPYLDDRLINNFTGMMPTFDDGNWYRNKYQTSLGYKYVTGSNQSLTPSENLKIPNYRTDILDFMWNVNKNQTLESNNRLIANATAYVDITKGLQLTGKLATDWTARRAEYDNYSTQPIVFGPSGGYGTGTNSYSILYGDLLLTYSKKLSKDLDLKAMAGYTGDRESSYSNSISTSGGLTTENRFDLTSSANSPYNSGPDVGAMGRDQNGNPLARTFLTKDALLGTVNLNYKGFLYVEGTVRRDRTSTMNPNNNSFVYPSANAAFVISDAFKLPEIINYAKLRGAWGTVGNYPQPYQANVAYSLNNLGVQSSGSSAVLTTTAATGTYGNDNIRPEKKTEFEFGLETRMLNNRLNFDLSFYDAKVSDMIVPLGLAPTTGANGILANVGTLRNYGLEVNINGTLVRTRNFTWEPGVNFSFNNNKILKLTTGSSEFIHADYDGNAAVLKSVVGRPIGDFYAHPILTDGKGQNVIADYGNGEFNYQIDGSKLQRYGNALVKAVGGFYNKFTYKNFALEIYTDFRIGGSVMPTGLFWMTSRGLTKESLTAMDAAHGGVAYYKDANGRGIATTGATGPNGQTVYHDGIKMGGVFPDGTPNTYVTSQFYYYWDQYNWGGPQYSNSEYFKYIETNTYWKVREISFAYTLPQFLSNKIKANRLQLSVFGRNLFYLYRTIKDMDAEQLTTGLNWAQQVNNAGSQPSTRTYGVALKANF
ncbi:MAG: SusC/RagA family TonB-linked outer membrane protein [Bacteroidetes bacterium]|nr:SusC/RagA family TonB-linked outer membrane protein [Bacteroidota bacterium]